MRKKKISPRRREGREEKKEYGVVGKAPHPPTPFPPRGGRGLSERARGAARPSPYITPSLARALRALAHHYPFPGEGAARSCSALPLPWRGRCALLLIITPSLAMGAGLPDYFLKPDGGKGAFREGEGRCAPLAQGAARPCSALPLPWQWGRDYPIIFSNPIGGRDFMPGQAIRVAGALP